MYKNSFMAKNKALSGTIKDRVSVKVPSGGYARVNPNTDEIILWNKERTSHYTDCITKTPKEIILVKVNP